MQMEYLLFRHDSLMHRNIKHGSVVWKLVLNSSLIQELDMRQDPPLVVRYLDSGLTFSLDNATRAGAVFEP